MMMMSVATLRDEYVRFSQIPLLSFLTHVVLFRFVLFSVVFDSCRTMTSKQLPSFERQCMIQLDVPTRSTMYTFIFRDDGNFNDQDSKLFKTTGYSELWTLTIIESTYILSPILHNLCFCPIGS